MNPLTLIVSDQQPILSRRVVRRRTVTSMVQRLRTKLAGLNRPARRVQMQTLEPFSYQREAPDTDSMTVETRRDYSSVPPRD